MAQSEDQTLGESVSLAAWIDHLATLARRTIDQVRPLRTPG